MARTRRMISPQSLASYAEGFGLGLHSRPIPATNDRKLTFNAMKHQLSARRRIVSISEKCEFRNW
jgi:hypothetical protein